MKMCDRCRVSGCCLNYLGEACKRARERECPDVVFTNADRIRAMTDEELQKFLSAVYSAGTRDGNMRDGFVWDLEWLRKPAEEE